MSELYVPEGERGVIRVFALLADPKDMDAAAVSVALGLDTIDMDGVEVIPMSDLSGLGLAGYLVEGLGIAEESLADYPLDGIGEAVVIVHSAALQGRSVTLAPRPPLQFAAVYQEADGTPGDLMPLNTRATEGAPLPPAEAPADATQGIRWYWWVGIGAAVGFVLAFALVFAGGGA